MDGFSPPPIRHIVERGLRAPQYNGLCDVGSETLHAQLKHGGFDRKSDEIEGFHERRNYVQDSNRCYRIYYS